MTVAQAYSRAVRQPNGCLINGSEDTKCKYGLVEVDGKTMGAHRGVWITYYGPIPDRQCVCHTCDRTRCIEPSHLFLGTQGDNIRDAATKGRMADRAGANNPNSRFYRKAA